METFEIYNWYAAEGVITSYPYVKRIIDNWRVTFEAPFALLWGFVKEIVENHPGYWVSVTIKDDGQYLVCVSKGKFTQR